MRRRRRDFTTFSLSFIDCMSCGLGAVVLLFMIINHATEVRATDTNRDVADKVSRLESEVLEKRQAAQALAAALQETEQQTAAAEARAARLQAALAEQPDSEAGQSRKQRVAALQNELRRLESEVEQLREAESEGDATREYVGEGDRQYLTGLKVGGQRILILVDVSASMLDDTVVGVIRRRNMSAARQRRSAKWRRALDTVDWITTQVPATSRFQMYAFNTATEAVLEGTGGKWLGTDGGARLDAAIAALRQRLPGDGTSLQNAFSAANRLEPKPDNIYLITDGLPTQGASKKSGTVSASQRLRLYRKAVDYLPRNVPVNVLMLPMEGDPLAASAFWQLAKLSGGSFLSPSRDWP